MPWLGPLHDLPIRSSWLKFTAWARKYGSIYQIKIFGIDHVWISEEKVATELMAKKARIYSDRPLIPNLPNNRISGEYLALLGSTSSLSHPALVELIPALLFPTPSPSLIAAQLTLQTATWKRQRKQANHLMHASDKEELHGYPTIESDRFLHIIGQKPPDYRDFIEQFTSRTVSRLAWGTKQPADILRNTTFGLLESISPSGALPNTVPALRYLPPPSNPWKTKERTRHALERLLFKHSVRYAIERTRSKPFDGSSKDAAQPIRRGRPKPTRPKPGPFDWMRRRRHGYKVFQGPPPRSFINTFELHRRRAEAEEEERELSEEEKHQAERKKKRLELERAQIRMEIIMEALNVVGLMAIAGALTIGSPIQSYLLAMTHYPEWQQMLQGELDGAIDENGCPHWESTHILPLLRAVVKETIRWRPPVPTGKFEPEIDKDTQKGGRGGEVDVCSFTWMDTTSLPLPPFLL